MDIEAAVERYCAQGEKSPSDTCREFLDALFGESLGERRKLTIFTTPDRASRRFDSIGAAVEYVASCSPSTSVYHGLGTIDAPRGRGTADEVLSISALWCDIDVKSDAHPSDKLPKTIDEAASLLAEMPLAPSVVVASGNGIHAYWLLAEPWIFADESDRSAAKRLAKQWHGLVCQLAKGHGWEFENLGDLARVLRTPGTVNPKCGKLVEIIASSGARYERAEFERRLPAAATPTAPAPQWPTNHGPDLLDRVRRYLDKVPPAIEGQAGGTQTLLACKALFRFGLDDAAARQMFEHFNVRCSPPWTNERQIAHKLSDAKKSVIGEGSFGSLADRNERELDVDLSRILSPPTIPISVGRPQEETIVEEVEDETDDAGEEIDAETGSTFPSECLAPEGLLGEIMDHTLCANIYPQPELALAAAIAFVGTITGRKVTDCTRTRTNVYVLGLGLSGCGKEAARQTNKRLAMLAGGEALMGSERVGSHAGIVTTVHDQPACLMQLDEMGRLLETMKNPAKSPHLYNCVTVLMQLYSSSGTIWKADAYADAKRIKTVDQPHLCIYGTATPDSFWHSLSRENIGEGLVGRLLVFEGRGYGDLKAHDPTEDKPSQELVDAVRWWLQFQPGGNLATEHPEPRLVPHTPEAKERMKSHVDAINERRRNEDNLRAAVWSRSAEKVSKLALIHACSRSRCLPETITRADVDWAVRLGNYLTRRLLVGCREHVSENETESKMKRVFRLITKSGITASKLTKSTPFLVSRERDAILKDLLESNQVVREIVSGKTKSTIVYRRRRTG